MTKAKRTPTATTTRSSLDIAGARLLSQHVEGRPLEAATDVVRWLVASQAQDFAGAKWAVGLRTAGATDTDVEQQFDSGAILRTHVLRPTWHFVAQEDIRWLLSLTGPRVGAVNGPRYRALGLDTATLGKASGLFERALGGGKHLTRDELRDVLARARIDTRDQRMAYMLMHAELSAAICSGPRRGKQFTYALFEERAPRARELSRDEALAELAGRYFESRGPATPQDFAKWSGLSATDARRGLEAVAVTLREETINGTPYWSSSRKRAAGRDLPVIRLLSIYDEYISSYRDRTAMGDPAYAKRLVGMGAALTYVLFVDGKVAGTWKRTLEKRSVRVEVTAFRALDRAEVRALEGEAERFARFTGGDRALDLVVLRSRG